MRAKVIGIIFKKQLVEILRDRRAIFVIFILPLLLYPIMIVGFAQMSIFLVGKMEKELFPVIIENRESSPELMALFEEDTQLTIVTSDNPDSQLANGDILAKVTISDGFSGKINSGERDTLQIFFNGAEERSEFALSHILEILDSYEKHIVTKRVTSAGLDSFVTDPIVTIRENIATKEKMGGMVFGRVLAMILVLMVISGAYYSSIDMVAGEKERGTLETLLVSPAGRMEIVIGKYLTVLIMAFVNALLNLVSMGLTMSVGIDAMGGELSNFLSLSLAPGTLALILIQLIPLAALFSAAFLAISSSAKSYKEAQGYLTPLLIAAELPAMAALLPGLELNTGLAFVPVLNVSLLIKQLMVGSVGIINFAIVWISTAIFAILALKWASSIISNEEALLSESGGSPLSRAFASNKSLKTKKNHAGASDAFFLFAVAVALLWWVGTPVQMRDIVAGLLITEVLLVSAPAYLLARRLNLNIKETFRIKNPNLPRIFLTIPLGIAGFVLITQFQVLSNMISPISPDYLQQFEGMLNDIASLGIVGGLAVLAVIPAICEEILFRGYILDGLTRKWGPILGIVIAGVLFGAFHLDPFRLIPASLLGIVYGIMVFRRGSIFYGMGAHVINNSCAFLASIYGESICERYFSGEQLAPIWLIIIAIAIFTLCFALIIKKDKGLHPHGESISNQHNYS
ncbi:CPBP family intramembrane metalloprotease [bacterium]|nr:CPBP family intramembrane metalloprotease [bacterium]